MTSFADVDNCGWTENEKVHEATRMLLRHLKGTDRMVPIGDTHWTKLSREIIGLKLQRQNKTGRKWWKVNPDRLDQRLRSAGLDPATYEILLFDLWKLAVERARGDIRDRKAQKRIRKTKRRQLMRGTNGTGPHRAVALPAGSIGEYLSLSAEERAWRTPSPVDPEQDLEFGSVKAHESKFDRQPQPTDGQDGNGQRSREQRGAPRRPDY